MSNLGYFHHLLVKHLDHFLVFQVDIQKEVVLIELQMGEFGSAMTKIV